MLTRYAYSIHDRVLFGPDAPGPRGSFRRLSPHVMTVASAARTDGAAAAPARSSARRSPSARLTRARPGGWGTRADRSGPPSPRPSATRTPGSSSAGWPRAPWRTPRPRRPGSTRTRCTPRRARPPSTTGAGCPRGAGTGRRWTRSVRPRSPSTGPRAREARARASPRAAPGRRGGGAVRPRGRRDRHHVGREPPERTPRARRVRPEQHPIVDGVRVPGEHRAAARGRQPERAAPEPLHRSLRGAEAPRPMSTSTMTKRQRVTAALRGEAVDRPPLAFWLHNFATENSARGLADETLRLHRAFDWDFLKPPSRAQCFAEMWGLTYTPSGEKARQFTVTHAPLATADDLARLPVTHPVAVALGEQLDALRLIQAAVGPDVPIIWT